MRLFSPKYNIWHVMLATAVVACLYAVSRFSLAPEIGAALTITLLPIVLAGRGRRLRAAAWVCSLYPLWVLGSFYAIWLSAWCILGHRPRIGLDDPDRLSAIVTIAIKLNEAFLLGLPIAFLLVAPLVFIHDVQSFRTEGLHPNKTVARLLIPPIVWSAVFGIFWLQLFGVRQIMHWFWD